MMDETLHRTIVFGIIVLFILLDARYHLWGISLIPALLIYYRYAHHESFVTADEDEEAPPKKKKKKSSYDEQEEEAPPKRKSKKSESAPAPQAPQAPAFNISLQDINPIGMMRREMIEWLPIIDATNEFLTQWIPNVGWFWKIGDQAIEYQRARNGLPPMRRVSMDPRNIYISYAANPQSRYVI